MIARALIVLLALALTLPAVAARCAETPAPHAAMSMDHGAMHHGVMPQHGDHATPAHQCIGCIAPIHRDHARAVGAPEPIASPARYHVYAHALADASSGPEPPPPRPLF